MRVTKQSEFVRFIQFQAPCTHGRIETLQKLQIIAIKFNNKSFFGKKKQIYQNRLPLLFALFFLSRLSRYVINYAIKYYTDNALASLYSTSEFYTHLIVMKIKLRTYCGKFNFEARNNKYTEQKRTNVPLPR